MTAPRHADRALFRRLIAQARPYWPHITGIFLLDLLATPLALLGPIPLKVAVDSVIGDAPLPAVLQVIVPDWMTSSTVAALVMIAVLQVGVILLLELQSLSSYVLRTYTGEGLTLGFQSRLFRYIQRLSLAFHDMRGTADSIYRIQYDAPAIQWVSIYGILPLVSAVVMLLGMLAVTAQINVQLALVALLVLPCLFILSYSYNRRMRDRYHDTKILESNALKVIQEVLTAMRVVKAFRREESEQDRFVRQASAGVRQRVRLSVAEGLFGLLINVTTALGTAGVLFIGIRNVQAGYLTLGELLMVIAYLTQLYGPLKTISQQVAGMQSSLASMQRAFELLDEAPDVQERPNAQPLVRAAGSVEFRQVGFEYDPTHPVLHDVSFHLAAGTRLGIAGHTGAGKTTLVSLMTRFYDPSAGQILLDGVDLRDYRLDDLRNQCAIVLQEPVLFSTSIAENIAYAKPDASEDAIIAAAQAANAHVFITQLPQGYDTPVGERGMRLSGGERQRIALARAFLKDAPILILDEPTSSVDIATEAIIIDAMERLMENRTTLMIAHRLSTLKYCDAILKVEKGGRAELTSDVLSTIESTAALSRVDVA